MEGDGDESFDTAILPMISLDADPATAPLVELATFEPGVDNFPASILGSLSTSTVEAASNFDKDELIQYLNTKRDGLLNEADSCIAANLRGRTTAENFRARVQAGMDAAVAQMATDAAAGMPVNPKLAFAADVNRTAVGLLNRAITVINHNITLWNHQRDSINRTFDEIIRTIRTEQIPVSGGGSITMYYSDEMSLLA